MSGAIATAYVKLIPTFDKQLKSSIEKQLGGVDGKKAGSKVGSLFTKGVDSGMSGLKTSMTSRFSAATVAIGNIAARAFTGAMSAVASSMDSAINRVDIIENFPKVMTSLGYSAEESAASMNIMKQAVDGLPTRLQDVTTNVQTLAATMGNLSDGETTFDPDKDMVAPDQLEEIDKWALMRLDELTDKVNAGYNAYDFHIVFKSIHNYCTVDLSSFYLDIIKDRLYCEKVTAPTRRAAQCISSSTP